jgi:hypothetical protein
MFSAASNASCGEFYGSVIDDVVDNYEVSHIARQHQPYLFYLPASTAPISFVSSA